MKIDPALLDTLIKLGTPIVAAIFGLLILHQTKRLERAQWKNNTLTEKRLKLFEAWAPKLNLIYCYIDRKSDAQSEAAKDILEVKRNLDKDVHTNKFIITPEFFAKYKSFISAAYSSSEETGRPTAIRNGIYGAAGGENKDPEILQKYEACMAELAKMIDLSKSDPPDYR